MASGILFYFTLSLLFSNITLKMIKLKDSGKTRLANAMFLFGAVGILTILAFSIAKFSSTIGG